MGAMGIATLLAALLLPAICPVAGAPMFPRGGSYFLDRSVDGFRQETESRPAWNDAVVHQSHPPAYADRSAQFQAQPDAFAGQHYDSGMYMRSNVPQNWEPDQLDASSRLLAMDSPPHLAPEELGEMVDYINDRGPYGQGRLHPMPSSHSRSPSMELWQQQHLDSPAGHASFVSDRPFASGPNEMQQRMDALGSSSSSLSLPTYPQAGPSSLPGEPLVGPARPRRGRPPGGTPRMSAEESLQRKRESAKRSYHKNKNKASKEPASVEANPPAFLQNHMDSDGAVNLPALDAGQLLGYAKYAFNPARTALQAGLKVSPNSQGQAAYKRTTHVYSTPAQTEIIQRILDRRLGMMKALIAKQPRKARRTLPDQLRLKHDPEFTIHPSSLHELIAKLAGQELVPLAPFEVLPEPLDSYLQPFVLGEYVIKVHNPDQSHGGRRSVYAYPRVKLEQKRPQHYDSDPKTIFLGHLYLESSSEAARTPTR